MVKTPVVLYKTRVIGIIILFIGMSVVSSTSNIATIKHTPIENQLWDSGSKGDLVDNVKIKWFGTSVLIDIFLAILNLPVYYTRVEMKNNNEIPFNYEIFVTLSTRDGKILYERFLDPPFKHEPHSTHTYLFFTCHDWQRFDYTWGPFDITLDYHILDDDSRVKMLFQGFVFRYGALIFNKEGEIIE